MPTFFYQGQRILEAEADLGEVWLSGMHFAKNESLLRQNRITAVVAAVDLKISYSSDITVHLLNLRDRED